MKELAGEQRLDEDGFENGGDVRSVLTPEERRAIESLKRLSRRWPRTLTLASMGGSLVVIHTGDKRFLDDDGEQDRDEAVLASIHGIPNTGGDW